MVLRKRRITNGGFHPNQVKNGMFIGGHGSYMPQMWIDTDRKIFYYKITD